VLWDWFFLSSVVPDKQFLQFMFYAALHHHSQPQVSRRVTFSKAAFVAHWEEAAAAC